MSSNLFRAFVLAVGALLIASGSGAGAFFGGLAVVYALWNAPGHDEEERLDELEARLDDVKTCLKAVEERP